MMASETSPISSVDTFSSEVVGLSTKVGVAGQSDSSCSNPMVHPTTGDNWLVHVDVDL